MTRAEFESKSFEEVMEQLNEECDEVTTIDILKEFIKEKVDSDDFYLVAHLCDAIWNVVIQIGIYMTTAWEH